jgi:hypothetical protein
MQIAEVQLYGISLLISQTLAFRFPTQLILTNTPITLSAAASSGLPVTFSVLSGPATLNRDQLLLTGVGQVTIRAEQAGNSQYQAVSVDQTFTVTSAGGVNEPPSVTTPTNVVDMNWNSSVSIPYYITDPDSTLDLTNIVVTSAFPFLVPNTSTNIVVTGGPVAFGRTGTANVTVTPAPDTIGSGGLIFILTDGYNYPIGPSTKPIREMAVW